ncbi:DUF58 domain-containing protein [Tumidithrix helvetica]|uniref:DUF58 domain-containing protein n=1 Tax=Tumidithrix helvetica TaxID=3457545 RepID=UPI003CC6BDA7
MIPARRTYWLFLGVAAIAVAIAILTPEDIRIPLSVLLILLGDLAILGTALWDAQCVKRDRVEVSRQHLSRLSIGRDNPVTISVKSGHGSDRAQQFTVLIRDRYPQVFGVSVESLAIALPANHTEDLSYTVCPLRRGEYDWGNIQVRQLGRWQLAWHDWTVEASQKVAVYPDLLALRSLTIPLTLQSTGSIRQVRRMGMGTEFAELREYSIGDDPRLIDWKATARRSRPLVRVLEPEQEQTLIILLDRGRLMTANIGRMQRFDLGLNATLSLALAGLHRGDRVGVGVFDRQMHTWIPPERGQTHLNKLIERLTPLQPEFLEPDYLNAVTTVVNQQTRRALVVIITDIVDAIASSELLAALSRLVPRYLPFCVTLRDPQIDLQANALAADVMAGYSRAVALDLLTQRQLAFANLQRKGVLVLDAPANLISDRLVDRYLLLKARNQL